MLIPTQCPCCDGWGVRPRPAWSTATTDTVACVPCHASGVLWSDDGRAAAPVPVPSGFPIGPTLQPLNLPYFQPLTFPVVPLDPHGLVAPPQMPAWWPGTIVVSAAVPGTAGFVACS